MQAIPKKLIVVLVILAVTSVGAVWVTSRATRTEIDPAVAGLRQDYTCPKCGYTFPLSMTDAARLRRVEGDIVCPKCGKAGAFTEAAASAGEFMANGVPPPTDGDESDSSQPKPRKPGAPTATLSKKASE